MKVRFSDGIGAIEVQPEETLIVDFYPDGANTREGSTRMSLIIRTRYIGGDGRMALTVGLPNSYTYRPENTVNQFILLEDVNAPDEIVFDQERLVRVVQEEDDG